MDQTVVYICMCYTKIVIHKYIYLYNCLLYLACIVIMLKPMASWILLFLLLADILGGAKPALNVVLELVEHLEN